MDNNYLQDLINEAKKRDGGLILNSGNIPEVVVLTVEKYNQLMAHSQQEVVSNVQKMEKQELQPSATAKVLVTGGAGYIGGHLVYELIRAGCEVVILDNLSSGKKQNIHKDALFIEGDLTDENLLRDIFTNNKIEAVFHMAASLEVEESVRMPEKYIQNNVGNTIKLLSIMKECGVRNIIFSSTAAVYGDSGNGPIIENSLLKPNNPYGSSKLLAERAIKYFSEYSGLNAVVFRYFNACGFNIQDGILSTHQSHLIYNVIQVAKGVKSQLDIYGNDYETFDGTCIRDYVHVTDIVLPHILAFKKMLNTESKSGFEVFNIGTGKGYSVEQVVNTTTEVLNKIIPMQVCPRRAGDAAITIADNDKLLKGLGYDLKYSTLENMIQTSWQGLKDLL